MVGHTRHKDGKEELSCNLPTNMLNFINLTYIREEERTGQDRTGQHAVAFIFMANRNEIKVTDHQRIAI